MRAVIVRQFTSYDGAAIGELEDPLPGPGEVVVDLAISDVNYPDILYIEGKYQAKLPFPFSPGLGGAGRIAKLGSAVEHLVVGQKVMVLPAFGSYAGKVRAAAEHCFAVPDAIPFAEAAALGLAYQTAYFALVERAGLKTGETVFVLGSSGGIGMAAIQLAKALGAGGVIAATRSDTGSEFARAIGADLVVDAVHLQDGNAFRDAVKAATAGRGADVVIDPVGGAPSNAALRSLAWCGRLVTVGFVSGEIPRFAANYLLVKNISVSGLQWTDYRDRQIDKVQAAQREIFRLSEMGRLRPVISRQVPLAQYADALSPLRHGTAQGKLLLSISEETTA